MRLQSAELVELLAQRYVVGTQQGAARRRFASLIQQRADVREAVARWEQRLVPLAWELEPITPSDLLWQRIVRQTGAGEVRSPRISVAGRGVWRGLAAACAMLAIFEALWLTRIGNTSGELAVRVVGNVLAQPGNDYQLWALTEAGVPVSLGLLPQSGSLTISLGSAERAALERSSTLAVSLEPPGGSPKAVPTGPVLYTAPLLAS